MIRKPQVHTKAAAFQIALKRWLSRYRVTPSLMRGPVRIVGLDNVRQHQHVLHARAGGFHAHASRARRHRVALALGWSGSCPAYTYYKYTQLFVSRSTAKEFPHGLAGLFEEAFPFLFLEVAFRSQGGCCSSSTPRMLSVSGNLS